MAEQRDTTRIIPIFVALIIILSATLIVGMLYHREGVKAAPPPCVEEVDTVVEPPFLALEPHEGLWDALEYYEIQHPEIVYAQAIQESGLGKSDVYLRTNNLFGLYNSYTKDYYKFNHWSESVLAYKNYIQRRYKPPNDYYRFLKRIHYASDPSYIKKIKSIVKRENDKRRIKKGDTIP